MDNGYNPIRWDCLEQGCYMHKCHPRIEVFADCFPNKIAMSDIDGVVEINGNFLFMEWKGDGGKVSTGQHILLQRLTQLSDKVVAYVVYGDSQTMQVHQVTRYYKGNSRDYDMQLEQLKEQFRNWGQWVKR